MGFSVSGETEMGNVPSFVSAAADPADAGPLCERFAAALEAAGVPTRRGVFGAHMDVELVNDGPVTLILGN